MLAEIENDEFDSVPEPEHVELVMDGLLDTITGEENLSLTYAQRYLEGAMFASGMLRSSALSSVAGNEGVFSAIGNGLQAVWNYIKKMFSNIWNFFFGSGDDTANKTEDDTKKAVAEDTAKIKEVASPTNLEETAKQLSKKHKGKADNSQEKSNPIAELLAKNRASGKKLTEADFDKAVREYITDNKIGTDQLKKAIHRLKESGSKLMSSGQTEFKGVIQTSSADALHKKMMPEVKTVYAQFNTLAKQLGEDITTVEQSLELQKALDACIAVEAGVAKVIARHKSEIKQEINKLQSKMTNLKDKIDPELSHDLEGCKALLILITRLAKIDKAVYTEIKAVSRANATFII